MTPNRHGSAVIEFPSELEIVTTREFAAPIALVFDALTKPEHVSRWFAPFECKVTTCSIDLRAGGTYHIVFVTEDGTECSFRGTYLEVEPPTRTVATWLFEGWPDAEAVETVELREAHGVTTLTVTLAFRDKAGRDHMTKSDGQEDSFDKLEDLLRSLLDPEEVIVPTRAAILDTLAGSQTRVVSFFRGLSREDLERPVTASDVPGAAPWRAKDHLAHLVKSERSIQRLLGRALAGETRDGLLRLQYPEGMPLPRVLGDLNALTSEETERLVLAVADVNQASVDEHHDDSLETLTADYLAARRETLDLLHRFTDDQLAAPVATVVGDQPAGDLFAGRAEHAAQHIASVEEGLRQGAW